MSRIKQIVDHFFQHEYPKDVQEQFHRWLLDDSFGKDKNEALNSIWNELQTEPDQLTAESFRKVQQSISLTEKPKTHLWAKKALKIAAMWIIPLLSVFGSYLYVTTYKSTEKPVHFTECFVPNGKFQTVTLPDGSVVKVNSGSILIYPDKFNTKDRSIYLNGEAIFSVVKDETKPFVVKTADMDISVLGTVFNVSSYSESDCTTTTLQSGKIHVCFKDSTLEDVLLKPDEQIVYNRMSGEMVKKQVNVEHVLAWQDGHLVFQGATIKEISKIIERRYNVSVYLNSNRYEREVITAKFIHGENLEESLQILKEIIPRFKYRIEDKKVFIY